MKARTICGSWRTIMGVHGNFRSTCRQERDHPGDHDWQESVDEMGRRLALSRPSANTYEPDPMRNLGPYLNADEVIRQFNAATFGIPYINFLQMMDLVIGESLLLGEVNPSEFEADFFRTWAEEQNMEPMVAQIIGTWILRAHLAGIEKGRAEQG